MPRGGVILNVWKDAFLRYGSVPSGSGSCRSGLDGRPDRVDHGCYNHRGDSSRLNGCDLRVPGGSPDGRALKLRGRASFVALAFLLCFPFWPDLSWAAAPVLTSISPSSAIAGAAGFTLTLTGSAFVNLSSVLWNGSARPTTFVSSTSLTATIYASDVADSGSKAVSVTGSTGTSGVKTFTVTCGNPRLISVSPLSLIRKDSGNGSVVVNFDDDPACGPWQLVFGSTLQSLTAKVGWLIWTFNWAVWGQTSAFDYTVSIENGAGKRSADAMVSFTDDPFWPFLYILTGVMAAMAFIYGFGTKW